MKGTFACYTDEVIYVRVMRILGRRAEINGHPFRALHMKNVGS